MNRLRVCLVSAAYHPYPSGVSEHVHHLALNLLLLGHDVEVLTTRFPGRVEDSNLPFPVTRIGRAVLVPMNRSYATLPVGRRLPGQVRRFLECDRFDIVHCHGFSWPETAYWAIMSSRVPVVVTFHTFSEKTGRLTRAVLRRMLASANRRISARIAVSESGRRWAESFMPGRYHVIPNGVDIARFTPGAPLPAALRRTGRTVLYVGRLERRKGLPVLLAAMPALLRAIPDARLVVVGSGQLGKPCREQVQELGIAGRVQFVGRVAAEDLPGFYANCDVYCSPALGGEAMGIVLVEAMAAGRAVVASDISGYNEVIQDGVTGVLCPPGNAEALAQALADLLASEDRRARVGNAALSSAARYAWPEVTGRIEGVYREVIPSVAR